MGENLAETRREVIKHSAAIQIQNNITLLQRKVWNVFLYNAYNALLEEDEYTIPVRELRKTLDYQSNDEEYLKEIIRALVSCTVEWNILNKDGQTQWGVAALLADAQFENGLCTYSYGSQLRKRLHNPSMYARLSLSMQNRFDSKYAQALWELCVDYLGATRVTGETKYISVEDVRKLLGVPEGSYLGMKKLNQKVLKPAVVEINRVSDLQVTVDSQRKGNKVTALKFKVQRVAMLPALDHRQPSLFPDLEDIPNVVKRLKDAGLSEADAWQVYQKGFAFVDADKRPVVSAEDDPDVAFFNYVDEKVQLLRLRQRAKQGVGNPAGFLLMALRKNYSDAQVAKQKEVSDRADKMRQLKRLEKERERLKVACDDALKTLSDEVVRLDGQAKKAFAALREQGDFGVKHWYNGEKSALENYDNHHALAVSVGKWLEGQFPVQFGEVRQRFSEPLAKIEQEISVFEAEGISTKFIN